MAEHCPVLNRATAPLLLILAATALSVLLLWTVPVLGAVEHQRTPTISNSSLCKVGINGAEGGGGPCLAMAEEQPELEGLEIAAELGSVAVDFHRSLQGGYVGKTRNKLFPTKAGCGREKRDIRYYSCTTNGRSGPSNPQQCSAHTRDNPCP